MDRFLTFRLASQTYALRSEEVLEVIRVPALARVPQGPPALRGIANLRGSILPVAGLRELLGFEPSADAASARAIVLDLGAPMAIIVDSVATLESAWPDRIETGQNALAAEGEEQLLGTFMTEARQVAKILDVNALLERAFSGRARARQSRQAAPLRAPPAHAASAPTEALVTFEVAGQEFALSIDAVQEILPAPASITAIARAEAAVLGITSVRGHLLPLLSLRTLLGLGAGVAAGDRQKVIVTRVGGAQVGLVADNARAIVAADPGLVEAVPPVLAARTGGESRITAVYRGEQGRRLISILSPDQLFKEGVMKQLASTAASPAVGAAAAEPTASGTQAIYLVFRLGGDEFGLPIESVVEVAQVPEQITRVPRTPKFLEGVVNLRGEVLPVVDQRRRFDMPKLENTDGRRLVVTRTDRHRAGLIVDSVSDVLRASADQVQPPPDLTEATSRLVRGVINLGDSGRMVLLLDPAELLTRAEQGLLDTFQKKNRQVGA